MRLLGLVVFLSWVSAALADAEPIRLRLGEHMLRAEVAATPAARTQGLMYRTRLDTDAGMLFVFPESGNYCMWMRNTRIPLSVAFLDARGAVINVAEMQAQSLEHHCAAGQARYALEMNAGWFARNGGQPGSQVRGLEQAPEPQ